MSTGSWVRAKPATPRTAQEDHVLLREPWKNKEGLRTIAGKLLEWRVVV